MSGVEFGVVIHLILLLFETTWFGSGLSAIFEKAGPPIMNSAPL